MAAYENQSGPVAVFVCVVCQILVKLVFVVLAVRHSLLLSPRSKNGVTGLSPGLLVVFLSSYTLSRITHQRFCSASTDSTIKFSAAPRSDAGKRLSW